MAVMRGIGEANENCEGKANPRNCAILDVLAYGSSANPRPGPEWKGDIIKLNFFK